MEKVVSHGLKIDLHIHSCKSSGKDGKKVRNNTKENINMLIDKLNANGVNICAITDHDTFSFEMYDALKAAEKQEGSIQKVLPGVEFSVRFWGDQHEEVIHVIVIFTDEDLQKVKQIESTLMNNRPDQSGSYSEESFLKVLREIALDTILIAHQKNTLSSQKAKKNDASILGEKRFYELVYSDYFEAFEFKNRRNEVINKNFLAEKGLEESIRFVTGTDCHDWSIYPREDSADRIEEFPFTYAKCLPTFRGLVMAVTDHSRLKRVDSFFSVDKYTLDKISVFSRSGPIDIPLSKGINVIIGDNSIGKSMLLHAITGYDKDGEKLPSRIKDGYKAYLAKNELKIPRQLSKEKVFQFDMQGEVRSKFEENKLNVSDFLSKNFPPNIDPAPYKAYVEDEIDRLIDYLTRKFEIDAEIQKLNTFDISYGAQDPESLIFEKNLRRSKEKTEPYNKIIETIDTILISYERLLNLSLSEQEHLELSKHKDYLISLKMKYQTLIQSIDENNKRKECVARIIDQIAVKHNRSITDKQKRVTAFSDNTSLLVQSIVDITRKKRDCPKYIPHIKNIIVSPYNNHIHEYEFISKIQIDSISTEYFLNRIASVLRSGSGIDWSSITEERLKSILLRYDNSEPCLQFLKKALLEAIAHDFEPKHTIICQGMDKSEELSAGLDAKIYFDVLSYESTRDGVYIIDQPEDNVSQPAIKSYLLSCFKTMGENRQVIIVTHNPQFIVNLDIDNLIFISKKNGEIQLQSGALEYECADYSILDIVANNIDGGLDSIQKRWKRYEKVNRV